MEEHYEGSTPRCRCFRTFVGFLTCLTMALPSTLLGASFVMVEDEFRSSLPWMTSMLSFHISAVLIAKHLCSLVFHRLNFELQLGVAGLLGGGALMLSMYGQYFIGFTAAMAIQGLCSGYLHQGIETYISLLWSNHKTRKILSYCITVTWSTGSILGPVLIFVIFNQAPTTNPGDLVPPSSGSEIPPAIDLPHARSFMEELTDRDINDTLAINASVSDALVPSLDSTGDIGHGASGNDTSPLAKMRNIKYIYGLFGMIEVGAGGAFAIMYLLLGPSFLRKDSVCMLSTKTNASLIGQPRCFGFGFVVLLVLFCCCFMNTEYFPKYLLSVLAVRNNNMSPAFGALMISAYEVGILTGRFLSLVSSCLISARIMLNIALFMSTCSFLLLLTALTLNDVVLYSAAFIIGVSVSNTYVHLFQWACNYMVITSFVRWASILGSILGCVIALPIIGFLVKALGYSVIAYMLLGASLGATVFLMVLQVYAAAARPVVQLSDPTDEELRTFARAAT